MLTAKKVELATSAGPERLLSDGHGLYLRVRPEGKSWLFKYTLPGAGKPDKMSLGTWPKVTLLTARKVAAENRQLLAAGKDPKAERIERQEQARVRSLANFEAVARAWHAHASGLEEWGEQYSFKILRMLELHAFPKLGKLPIGLITLPVMLDTLMAVAKAKSGTRETASRLRDVIRRIYAFAVTQGVLLPVENFMAPGVADLKLPKPRKKHRAALLDPARVGQLMRDMQAYGGHIIVCTLMRLMPLVFQRPRQVRLMDWEQLDLDAGTWNCPPELMKLTSARKALGGGGVHVVPLPRQAVALLRALLPVTGPSGPVFKSLSRRSEKTRYISDNTVNAALRAMGYSTQDDITGHGFRAMARTLIRERLGYDPDVIEAHLAHASKEELGAAYDRATFLAQRTMMVQAWADYLDELAATVPMQAASMATSA